MLWNDAKDPYRLSKRIRRSERHNQVLSLKVSERVSESIVSQASMAGLLKSRSSRSFESHLEQLLVLDTSEHDINNIWSGLSFQYMVRSVALLH